jgi:hypothetical protein
MICNDKTGASEQYIIKQRTLTFFAKARECGSECCF